jgi:exodeoxyribonuclease VII small subunit
VTPVRPDANGDEGSEGRGDVTELSYADAGAELDGIVEELETGVVDVDRLVTQLERATSIVDELDRRLRRTRMQVEELVPRLEAIGKHDTAAADELDELDGVPPLSGGARKGASDSGDGAPGLF